MATHIGSEFIVVPEDTRRVVREIRAQLGLSRATVEKRAKVGTDYIKRLELGRHPNVEATRLRRVLQIMQQAAVRGKVSAPLTSRLARGESRHAAQQTSGAVRTRIENEAPPRPRPSVSARDPACEVPRLETEDEGGGGRNIISITSVI